MKEGTKAEKNTGKEELDVAEDREEVAQFIKRGKGAGNRKGGIKWKGAEIQDDPSPPAFPLVSSSTPNCLLFMGLHLAATPHLLHFPHTCPLHNETGHWQGELSVSSSLPRFRDWTLI